MSATGRGAVRREADFYPTPAWTVRRLLEACPLPGGRWLEPGAGEGAIIRAVNQVRSDVTWLPVELRESCATTLLGALGGSGVVVTGDFLKGEVALAYPHGFDVALGNPPFALARAFVDEAMRCARHVVFLLRMSFLESAERAEWWEENPADVYPLRDRPSFVGRGTDACAYAWFHWHPGATWPTRLRPLPLTPKGERGTDRGRARLFGSP